MAKSVKELQEMFEGKGTKFNIPLGEAHWAYLTKPDDKFGTPGKFKINVILDDELADQMAAVGFNVKPEKIKETTPEGEVVLNALGKPNWIETGRRFIQPTRAEKLGPPRVTVSGKPFTGDIGNGSLVTCVVSAKFVDVAGKRHLPCYLNEIDVHDLVEFEGDGGKVEDIF